MIRDVRELSDRSVIEADVGIVGAGLAGIDIGRFLGERGISVALLESGRLEFDPEVQELARVAFAGKPQRTPETHGHISRYLPPMYRGRCRIRQFGGTTTVWTGKWRIFDPWDFEERSWIPYSGWPISLDDLLPYYDETARDYGFGDFRAAARGELFQRASRILSPRDLVPHLFFWEESPTRSGRRFFHELKRADPVQVILGATATEIVLHESLDSVQAITFQSMDGRSFTLRASRFVLASGGLETPRLLLASNRQMPDGVGNEFGLVGRFYMDHPKYSHARFRAGRAMKHLLNGLESQPRPRFAISFGHTEEFQRAESLPNHALFLQHVPSWRRGRFREFKVKLCIEQAPNPESRVYLDSEMDALGMPRLVVDWRFTPADRRAFASLQRSIALGLRETGVGRLDFGSAPVTLDDTMDASHHMGTTRMAVVPQDGVVDSNCKVFGTDNLFVASSSVFPTSHAYSPTYTILAVARRLAHHLHTRSPARRAPRSFSSSVRTHQ